MKPLLNLTMVLALLTALSMLTQKIVPPDQMVKNVASGVLDVIRNDKDIKMAI